MNYILRHIKISVHIPHISVLMNSKTKNVKCMFCFNTIDNNHIFRLSGKKCFCTARCAFTYNQKSDLALSDKMKNTSKLYSDYKIMEELTVLPPIELLENFGGKLSYEAFHKDNVKFNVEYMPIKPISFEYDEHIIRDDSSECIDTYKNNQKNISELKEKDSKQKRGINDFF